MRRTRPNPQPLPSEITPPERYFNRRDVITALAAVGAVGTGIPRNVLAAPLKATRNPRFSLNEDSNSFEEITTYNNFYEFGTDKADPAQNSGKFKPRPWSVVVAGECAKPGSYTLEDILKPHALEERIYRLRCVEAWSMVIPWNGFPLASLLNRFKPTSKAKYVRFETIERPREMPGQRSAVLDWPYREGLRIDEAMHPLTLLAAGLYGRWLPNQNGAPLRLVVPWKYGFKSIKSIVKIHFSETQPSTSWSDMGPDEYGFYANVNPDVDHPRWSQASERRIAEGMSVFKARIATTPFNGYADQVASMYTGLDPKTLY